MPHMLNVWPSVSRRLAEAGRVLLLFDYDGTLTPIVPKPEDAVLSPRVKGLLAELAATDGYLAGIVSGRSLADLRERAGHHGVGIRREPWAGNLRTGPGLRASGRSSLRSNPGRSIWAPDRIDSAVPRSKSRAQGGEPDGPLPGRCRRRCPPVGCRRRRDGPAVGGTKRGPHYPGQKSAGNPSEHRLGQGESHRDDPGFLPRPARLPVFFGDDRTDEDGFDVVQEQGGLAVFVGPPRVSTKARHRLESPDEVARCWSCCDPGSHPGCGVKRPGARPRSACPIGVEIGTPERNWHRERRPTPPWPVPDRSPGRPRR